MHNMDDITDQSYHDDQIHQYASTLVNQFISAAYTCRHVTDLEKCASFPSYFRDLRSNSYKQPSMMEIMAQSLDYEHGPALEEVFILLITKARNGDAQASHLLKRMASAYAYEQLQIS